MLTTALALLTVTAPLDAQAFDGYKALLKEHVKRGRVDYDGLEKNSKDKLDTFVAAVAKADLPKRKHHRIGFYIDAYNAIVLQSVLHHKKPRSVLDVKNFFKEKRHTVAGKKVSLDSLEKKVLNPYAKDPRTHFVLVCAAVGCPVLESRPFFESNVDKRMDKATRRYLASKFGARVKPGVLELSQIFNWYKDDFGGPDGVRTFVLKHLLEKLQATATPEAKVTHFDYNWTLNRR